MTGAILVSFVLYAYLPHAIFKVFAERSIDLGRRKDASQVEEIAFVLIPATVLHIQAIVILKFLWLLGAAMPPPDLTLIGSLAEPEGYRALAARLSDSRGLYWPVVYFLLVLWLAAINGLAFGRGMLQALTSGTEPREFDPPELGLRELPTRLYRQLKACFTSQSRYLCFKDFISNSAAYGWKLIYQENLVSIYPWTLEKPLVFVKEKDGSLFHGTFVRYDKAGDGCIEAIYLDDVSRFARSHRDSIRRGENPIHPLYGTLYIKWSEIADINVTLDGVIEDLYSKYQAELEGQQLKQDGLAKPTLESP